MYKSWSVYDSHDWNRQLAEFDTRSEAARFAKQLNRGEPAADEGERYYVDYELFTFDQESMSYVDCL